MDEVEQQLLEDCGRALPLGELVVAANATLHMLLTNPNTVVGYLPGLDSMGYVAVDAGSAVGATAEDEEH